MLWSVCVWVFVEIPHAMRLVAVCVACDSSGDGYVGDPNGGGPHVPSETSQTSNNTNSGCSCTHECTTTRKPCTPIRGSIRRPSRSLKKLLGPRRRSSLVFRPHEEFTEY